MNWNQLRAFIWLRWRLSLNQGRRLGRANVVIGRLIRVFAVVLAIGSLVAGYLLGRYVLADSTPTQLMMVFSFVVIAYLLVLLMGLMSEMQRSEMLSLERFLHLPVSPAGAFLINYVGSSLTLTSLLFVPGVTGLTVGILVSHGVSMWPLLLLAPAFFLMMTALLFQLRGWLASMMANRRRRQTILAVVTVVFLSVVMIPHFLTQSRGSAGAAQRSGPVAVQQEAAVGSAAESAPAGRTTPARPGAGRNATADEEATTQRTLGFVAQLRLVNAIAPPGWLPHGVTRLAEGNWLAALPPMFGMGLIGFLSLMRSYRTTLRLYRGEFAAGSASGGGSVFRPDQRPDREHASLRPMLVERRLPLVSEHTSAIAVSCFRSLLRSPELKIMLLSPLILVVVFSGMTANSAAEIGVYGRALRTIAVAIGVLLFTMLGFIGNQFAFDRDAFRAFMLSSASRRDILLGKNLSFLPFSFGFMLLAVFAFHWFQPLRPDHLVAVLAQSISVYLVMCMLGNALSIYAPIAVRPTNGMPIPGQGAKMLLQMAMLFVFAIPLGLTLIPFGIEYAIHAMGGRSELPIFLVLSLIQVALVVWLYLNVLTSQGMLLQRREQSVLDVVTQRAD